MTAFLFCEIILSFSIFHFPRYKHTEQYQCVEDPAIIIKKYPSGYECINGESGAFLKYNDVGLPGIYSMHRKKIAICGSSFIMGQLSADYLASSLVQKSLDSLQKDISILNLGEGNYVPYRSFHRVEFYNKSFDFNYSELPGYRMSLYNFKNFYNNKFIVINIGDDIKFNEELYKLCREMTIPYFYKNLMNPQNRFNMYGHFNKRGNLELARYIINVLKYKEII